MDNKKGYTAPVACLQKNLSAIRKIAGWTTEQLGEKIGVTKQTISNLENGKTPMTLTQYIAIRAIIDFEIQNNKENVVLPQVVEVLLNRDEEYTDEERERVAESVRTVAATAAGGVFGASLAAVSSSVIGGALGMPLAAIASGTLGIPIAAAGGLAASSIWLTKVLKGTDKKKEKEKQKEKRDKGAD